MRGRSFANERNTRDAPAATIRPRAAPARDTTKTSVKSCATTEALDAPSEKRTEISCSRAAARDSSRAAIFVHAMSNSSETDPNRINRDLLTPPTVASLSGSIMAPIIASVFGYSRPRLACTLARLARACASVTPGFRRPIAVNHVDSRLCA